MKWLLATFLFLGVLAVHAQATTWFVATNGNDGNSCTSVSSPCLSINGAYQKAVGGDTIQVAAGNYGAQTLNAKSPASDIIVQPATGAAVTLADLTANGSQHIELRSMTTRGFGVRMTTPPTQFVTLRNMTITDAIFYLGGNNISVIGGSIGPAVDLHSQIAPVNGWQGQANNFLFDGVLFHDFTRTSQAVHIECLQVAGTTNMIIRNSKFRHCDVFDLSFTSYNGAGSVNNLTLENNWFDTAGSGGYFSVHFSAMNGGTVRFNSATQGMFVDTTAPNSGTLAVTGNNVVGGILDGNSGGCLGTSMAASYNYNVTQGWKCGATDINAAPGFVNAGAFDLHLVAGSAPINVVPSTVAAPPTDIDGKLRAAGSAHDAGASEFSSVSAGNPNPPSGLQATVQ